MTEAETKKILKTLETAYPSIRARSQEQADENVRQWSMLEPYDVVRDAVHAWIADSRFPPKFADIRHTVDARTSGPSREELQSMARFRLRQIESGEFTVRGRPGTPEDIEAFRAKWRDFL